MFTKWAIARATVQNGNEFLEVDPAVEAVVNEVEDTDIMASLVERNPAIRFV